MSNSVNFMKAISDLSSRRKRDMVKILEATESSNSKKLLGLYYKNCHFSALQVIWLFTQVHLIIRSLVIFLLKEIWNAFLVFFILIYLV